LNEKYISDLQDEADSKPKLNLANYVTEWFLKRFGNK